AFCTHVGGCDLEQLFHGGVRIAEGGVRMIAEPLLKSARIDDFCPCIALRAPAAVLALASAHKKLTQPFDSSGDDTDAGEVFVGEDGGEASEEIRCAQGVADRCVAYAIENAIPLCLVPRGVVEQKFDAFGPSLKGAAGQDAEQVEHAFIACGVLA